MEADVLKLIVSKSDWLIITLFVIYLAFKIVMTVLENKKAKSAADLLKTEFGEIKSKINTISVVSKENENKDRILDSINNKLKIIYAQYGSELSKELAMIIINNIYFNFASLVANEIYELQKGHSYEKIVSNVKNTISIINDEKMQELDGFIYRNRHLVTYTTGQIIDPDKIIKVIAGYNDKNGLLRTEIENLLSIEAGIVIKRL